MRLLWMKMYESGQTKFCECVWNFSCGEQVILEWSIYLSLWKIYNLFSRTTETEFNWERKKRDAIKANKFYTGFRLTGSNRNKREECLYVWNRVAVFHRILCARVINNTSIFESKQISAPCYRIIIQNKNQNPIKMTWQDWSRQFQCRRWHQSHNCRWQRRSICDEIAGKWNKKQPRKPSAKPEECFQMVCIRLRNLCYRISFHFINSKIGAPTQITNTHTHSCIACKIKYASKWIIM